MIKSILFIILFFSGTFIFAQTGKIKVEVSNIKNEKGIIYIGIYNNPTTFPKENILDKKITAQKTILSHTFKNVKAGNYAVAIYHDENEDGKIDRYFFGMPSEDYGFSRNPKVFGLPKYEDCNFELHENKIVTVKIKLK